MIAARIICTLLAAFFTAYYIPAIVRTKDIMPLTAAQAFTWAASVVAAVASFGVFW